MNKFTFTKKRSISTIVGGFIFLIIVAAAFAALILMMQANTDFLRTQLDVSGQEIKKLQEQFTIGASYDATSANKLCVAIENTGSSPLEMVDLWISNRSASESPPYTTKQIEIASSDSFIPIGSIGQILENQRITMRPGDYNIKAVSSSGREEITSLRVFSNGGADPRLNVTVFAYPVNVASGQNITLGMHVYNRANTTLTEVQPNGNPTVEPTEAVQSYPFRTSPGIISRLDPNEDVIFYWDPEITGGVGSKLNFTASAKAKVEGCSTSSFITSKENKTQIKIVPGTRRQILASPETHASYPNPFGDASGTSKGKFALVVINPTDHDFKVSQVSLQLINSRAEDLVTSITGITPTGGWTEGASIIYWRGTGTSQITVPSNGMKTFIVDAQPIVTTSTPINAIVYNVYSTFGQFSSGPFSLGVSSSATAILQIYHNTTFAAGGVANYTVSTTSGVDNKRFNVTISNTGDTNIGAGAYMLINVPPGFRNIDNVTDTNLSSQVDGKSVGLIQHSFLEFDDGSTQIPIELPALPGGGTTKTYSFRATMPSISVPAFYTITLVANGTTTDATPVIIGPASEIVVQVCPTGGC